MNKTSTYSTPIQPTGVWPGTATILTIETGIFAPPPWYYASLSDSTGKTLAKQVVQMSETDWNAWPAGLGPDGDANYQLDSICRTLNLTRA